QESHELHTIHSCGRVKAIWSALAVFSISGAVFALFISNWAEPAARKTANIWTAQIAVDLLSQSLTPGRFTEVSNGVVIRIGGRNSNGIIEQFFADDQRDPNIRRTYMAERAEIVIGPSGYQISLRNGRLQATPSPGKFSEIEFARYDLAIENLTDPVRTSNPIIQRSTLDLINQGLKAGSFSGGLSDQLHWRFSEGPRVLALCLLIASLGAFPHGRRAKRHFPPELLVFGLAFSERSASGIAAQISPYGYYVGPVVMMLLAGLVLFWRFKPNMWSRYMDWKTGRAV
ncbi:MAG: LptF/LptG family permease, partial [Devosiaceae bacterium]|nr:LptF/LptG family permease [Devosiaceae bacterium]